MARTIGISKAGQATIVKVYEDGILQFQLIMNSPIDFRAEVGQGHLIFENKKLSDLGINYNSIDAGTITALSIPADNFALADALATGKYFQALT